MRIRIARCAVVACAAGCISWGHGDRLAYDARAREAIDGDIAAHVACVRAELSGLAAELPPLAELVKPMQARLDKVHELAGQGVQRARIAQLYFGSPQDLAIDLGMGKDQAEVIAFAGLAAQRAARRGWWRALPKRLMEQVAAFAVEFARVIAVEIPRAIVPWYVWWALGVAGAVALAIALYALYQRLVVVRRQARALDQHDESWERLPKDVRREYAKGPDLQREHIPRNERRRWQTRELEDEKRERYAALCERIAASKPVPGSQTGPDFLAAVGAPNATAVVDGGKTSGCVPDCP